MLRSELFRFTMSADAVRPNDNDEHVNLGGEFGYRDVFFVRAGYKSLFLADAEEGFTAGVGLHYPLFGSTAAALDYTYQEFGVFDGIQTITLSIDF